MDDKNKSKPSSQPKTEASTKQDTTAITKTTQTISRPGPLGIYLTHSYNGEATTPESERDSNDGK